MSKVKVPQKDGEIRIQHGADEEAKVYPVENGMVEVKAAELDDFLFYVDGAQPVDGKPASEAPKP